MKKKKCTNCFQTKPLTEFYRRFKNRPDYVQSRCKSCNAEVVKADTLRRRKRKFREWVKAS